MFTLRVSRRGSITGKETASGRYRNGNGRTRGGGRGGKKRVTVNETGVIRMGTSLGGRIRHEARGFGVFHFDIVAAAQEFTYLQFQYVNTSTPYSRISFDVSLRPTWERSLEGVLERHLRANMLKNVQKQPGPDAARIWKPSDSRQTCCDSARSW